MQNRIRFLSFDESSVSSLSAFLAQIISRNIRILEQQISTGKGSDNRGKADENVGQLLKSFTEVNDASALISQAKHCLE
jgi:hypothetical protein